MFLSYAREDSAAVQRMAEVLRAAGVEVWFDQNELVGGDAWDAKIRGQIRTCALFVPVISATTQARREGYFRIEWKLAAQRTHAIAEGTPFLLPVVIDAVGEGEALVPAEFRDVQWTRLAGGEVGAAFCARVSKLLGNEPAGRGPLAVPSSGGRELAGAPENRQRHGVMSRRQRGVGRSSLRC
ncbi:MAG: toll/interleukin-1 receptor domain-containing protein [Verrucomicrobia bacterium]|nr:toll/interleukin-1 receptor domain-containing protein [Verrucomicrobiota bacterium]